MRLTRLQLVERMGEQAFFALLSMAKQSIEVEGMMKLIEWAQPDPDGTSIDLTDQRFQKLYELEPMLIQMGVVTEGWVNAVLNPEPQQPAPPQSARIYQMPWGFVSKSADEEPPVGYLQEWSISGLYHQVIGDGADVSVDSNGRLTISKTVP